MESESAQSDISTFVFMDLETTGLEKEARITELSMVAISRKELAASWPRHQNTPKEQFQLPPIEGRFSKLYYPGKRVIPIVERITGITNEMLRSQCRFCSDCADEIHRFFQTLLQPVGCW